MPFEYHNKKTKKTYFKYGNVFLESSDVLYNIFSGTIELKCKQELDVRKQPSLYITSFSFEFTN